MALSELAIEQAKAALKSDIGATVAVGHESAVDHFAAVGRSFIDDDVWFTQWLVDEVQQYFSRYFRGHNVTGLSAASKSPALVSQR